MKDISQLIANLSPEKRALFLQKLQGKQEGSNSAPAPTAKKEIAPKVETFENFYLSLEKPGNLMSFRKVEQEILPPAKEQIQVQVQAASLNFRDLMMALNMYPATPGVDSVMGSDYAGVVTAVGEDVTEFKVGDEVICLSAGCLTEESELDPDSHFAAYTNIKANQATKKPKNLSWEEAASIPTVFLTSYYSLMHIARLQKGERVLIHTASGGVGQSAIQIAKWMDAEIFVTAGTPKKREFLESIGFDTPLDSRSLEFGGHIKERTSGEGIDVILNTIAGKAGEEGLKILRDFGRFVQIDKKDIAKNNTIPLGEFNKGLTYASFDLGLFYQNPALMKGILDRVSRHFSERDFDALTHQNFSIDELGMALVELSKAQHIGKITLTY